MTTKITTYITRAVLAFIIVIAGFTTAPFAHAYDDWGFDYSDSLSGGIYGTGVSDGCGGCGYYDNGYDYDYDYDYTEYDVTYIDYEPEYPTLEEEPEPSIYEVEIEYPNPTPIYEEEPDAPTCTLHASHTVINKGDYVYLNWSSTNADSAVLTGEGVVNTTGSMSVYPTYSRAYRLTAYGDGGEVDCLAYVSVIDIDEEEPDVPTCDIGVSDTHITKGDRVRLTWDSDNADEAYLSGYGSVDTDASKYVHPTYTRTYKLTVFGDGGTNTCSVRVNVDDEEPEAPTCDIDVSDTHITEGDRVRLTWDSDNADDAYLSGYGSVDTDASKYVRPTYTRTYELTVSGDGGTNSCSVRVHVDDDDDEDEDTPTCSLRISDRVVTRGTAVLLSWSNDDTDEMTIRDDHGNEIISADKDTDLDPEDGSFAVIPQRDTTYTVTARNRDGVDRCSVSVSAHDGVTIDYVPLTDVPYTGFPAGPVLTTLFYMLIGVWGSIVAYVILRQRYAQKMALADTDVVITPDAEPVVTKDISQENEVAPTAPAVTPANLPVDVVPAFVADAVAQDVPTEAFSLESYAADARVFITDEVRERIQSAATTAVEQTTLFDSLVASARAKYPTEHGWLTIDSARLDELGGV